MKKALVVCSLALLSFIPASAQFSWGLRGGVNFVNNDITAIGEEQIKDKESYTGYFLGPMAEVQIPIIGLGIDAALLYSQKGLKLAEGETMKDQSLSVPIYLKYTFGLGNTLGIFGQAGPQFDYKIGDLDKTFKTSSQDGTWQDTQKFILEQYTWSVNLGAGVKLFNCLQAAVNYNLPITKEGTKQLNENLDDGAYIEAMKQGSEAFKASTLQFIVTLTF